MFHNNISSKTIDVTDGKHKINKISINEYVNGINSFDIGMDPLNICKKLNIQKINQLLLVSKTTINVLKALRGDTLYKKKECNLLEYYNIGIQPKYTNSIRTNIANIKWIIYINIKNTNNINKIDNDIIYDISILCGLCMYFNELDNIKISNNQNNNNYSNRHNNYEYLTNICNKYTINEF